MYPTISPTDLPVSRRGASGFTTRPEDPDYALILRASRHRDAAYTDLWHRHYDALCGWFRKEMACREEAEDLAGETFADALNNLDHLYADAHLRETAGLSPEMRETFASLPLRCTFRTYLYAIARNKRARRLALKAKRPCAAFSEITSADDTGELLEARLGFSEDSNPLDSLLSESRTDELWYALADVGLRSTGQFEALLCHYGCNLSHKETAALLEERSETINTRLQEGRKTLQRHYQRTLAETALETLC